MNKSLILAAGILCSLVACQSRTERLMERAAELCAHIPGQELPSDAENYLTESYFQVCSEALAIPEWVEYVGEIGEKEFLFYPVSGPGITDAECRVKEVRFLEDGTAEAAVDICLPGEADGAGDEVIPATMKLVQENGVWRMDDFNGTKGKCLDFIHQTRASLWSGAALDSLRLSGWEEEDYLQRFQEAVNRYFEQFGPSSGPGFYSAPLPDSVFARMTGVSFPEGAVVPREELCYLRLSHYDFDGCEKVGEMVCHREIAQDLVEIFRALYEARYPIRSIRLIDDFGGEDEASMRADNTSCFNYRAKTGMRSLSKHALGLAVDVNPLENPYVRPSGVRPAEASPYADRTKEFAHKIDRNDLCYKLFREHGFSWGGDWRSVKDYQHFEK